ncbi:Glycoprotein X [Madurella fahalii]|uniref:Glycoprotein X n=1 Tax=Madurella fahalii TaxID=1157608 RepID=A0ABQ0GG17_9PEZI
MHLSGLIRGLGALSLVHLSFAVEESVYRRTNVSDHSAGSSEDNYEQLPPVLCDQTTVTYTETQYETGSAITETLTPSAVTVTVTETVTEITTATATAMETVSWMTTQINEVSVGVTATATAMATATATVSYGVTEFVTRTQLLVHTTSFPEAHVMTSCKGFFKKCETITTTIWKTTTTTQTVIQTTPTTVWRTDTVTSIYTTEIPTTVPTTISIAVPTTIPTTITELVPTTVVETTTFTTVITFVTSHLFTVTNSTTIFTTETSTTTDIVTATLTSVSTLTREVTDTVVSVTTLPASTILTTFTTVLPPITITVTEDGTTITTVIPGPTVTDVRTSTLPPVTVSVPGPTVTTSISVCSALPPSFTAPAGRTSDRQTWGCDPGFVCMPPKPSGCNLWPDSPSDDFLCDPRHCRPAPYFPWIEWPTNETGWYPPTEGYFNLNPEAFGLSYEIFEINEVVTKVDGKKTTILTGDWTSQATISHFPPEPTSSVTTTTKKHHYGRGYAHLLSKRDDTIVPAVCYSQCNTAYLECQRVGQSPALCREGAVFRVAYDRCNDCIELHTANVQLTRRVYLEPKFAQFVDFCDIQPPQSQVTNPPAQTQVTETPTITSETQAPPNTDTGIEPIPTSSTTTSAEESSSEPESSSATASPSTTAPPLGTSSTTFRTSATNGTALPPIATAAAPARVAPSGVFGLGSLLASFLAAVLFL